MAWTDERVEKLKKLWETGKSASEIAKELGDVTRNAVIGKVHRMGLQNRADATAKPSEAADEPKKAKAKKAKAPKPEPKVEVKPEPKAEPIEEEEEESADGSPFGSVVISNHDEISEEARLAAEAAEKASKKLNLMQLTERTCKWPVGDPATEEFWFCGHPSQAGKPYCEAHVELAFQAPMARRR